MALPLIAMMGAGLLSGGRLLMNQADQRKAEKNVGALQSYLQTEGAEYAAARPEEAQGLLAMAERESDGGSIMNPMDAAERSQNVLSYAEKASADWAQGQRDLAIEYGDMYSQSNQALGKNLEDNYRRDFSVFSEQQQQFRSAMTALDNPSNLNTELALYNIMAIVEPGGRLTQNEDGMLSGTGDFSNGVANFLNKWRGEGLTKASVEEIRQSVYHQYASREENYRARMGYWNEKMHNIEQTGRNVADPRGMLGISSNIMPPDYMASAPDKILGGEKKQPPREDGLIPYDPNNPQGAR